MEEIHFEVCPYGDSDSGIAAAGRRWPGYCNWTGGAASCCVRSSGAFWTAGIWNWGRNRAVKTHRLVSLFCPWLPWPLTFELWWDFCTLYLTDKTWSSNISCSKVIVRTNRQMPLKTSTLLRYATPVGNQSYLDSPWLFMCNMKWKLLMRLGGGSLVGMG